MRAEGSGQLIAEIQVLPTPAGTATHRWARVDSAIDVITRSGLNDEVGPLGTTVEGMADAVWDTVCRAHQAALAHTASGVLTVITVREETDGTSTMHTLTESHRARRG